jgi:hypothetical protein
MCENDNISEDEKSAQDNDIKEHSYYYDDSTGYEVYQENEDEDEDEDE